MSLTYKIIRTRMDSMSRLGFARITDSAADLQSYPRDMLQRMTDAHLANRLDELLRWTWTSADLGRVPPALVCYQTAEYSHVCASRWTTAFPVHMGSLGDPGSRSEPI
jgi:hypothetical protein